MFDRIRFKTTEHELNEVFNLNMVENTEQSIKCKNIVLIGNDNYDNIEENEDDNEVQWISGPDTSSNTVNVQQN
jgi:hypothetical protein